MTLDKIHLALGLVWLLIGMTLGQIMGESGDHTQMPTHAHIMLVGGALSIFWAVIYKVWDVARGAMGLVQFVLHHVGAIVMSIALYMLYGGMSEEAVLGPVLAIAGLALMISVLIMLIGVFRAKA